MSDSYTYKQPGAALTFPAPTGGVVAGRLYLVGVMVVQAKETAAQTVVTTFGRGGVHDLPKDGGASVSFTVGESVFWDPVNHRVAKTNAAHFPCGICVEAAANAATSVSVELQAGGTVSALVGG